MSITRIQAVYTGLQGMPAVSGFYFSGTAAVVAEEAAEKVNAFFQLFQNDISDEVTVDVDNLAVEYNEVTGATVAFAAVAGESFTGGGTPDPLPIGTSAVLGFQTAAVIRNRRLQGRVYMAGLTEGANGGDGLLDPPTLAQWDLDAATTLGGGGPVHVVWSRPINGAGGSIAPVTTYSFRQVLSNLRSRRR